MTDLFGWNDDLDGGDDFFPITNPRSLDDTAFQLSLHRDQHHDIAEWEDGNFASFETYEHLLSNDVEADGDFAHFLQHQTLDLDQLLSPPSKPSHFKKRVSPAKEIQHKRSKNNEFTNRNWKSRPDHLDVLGTSAGSSGIGSFGPVGALSASPALGGLGGDSTSFLGPMHTLGGVVPDLGLDPSMHINFESDELGMPISSTPATTPSKSSKRASTSNNHYPMTSVTGSGGKKAVLDWSDDEIRLFEEGLVLYSAPNWRQISAMVGTRTTSQTKTFSIKYFGVYGNGFVPSIDPARLSELRSIYFPSTSSGLNKSQRLKRTSPTASNNVSDKKISPPKHGKSVNSPSKFAGKSPASKYTSSSANTNHTRPAKVPAAIHGQPAEKKRRTDGQEIILEKSGDEDEDIQIEDEEVDIDGNSEDEDDMRLLFKTTDREEASDDENEDDEDDMRLLFKTTDREEASDDENEDEEDDHAFEDANAMDVSSQEHMTENKSFNMENIPQPVTAHQIALHQQYQYRKSSSNTSIIESSDMINEESMGYSDLDSSNGYDTPLRDSTSSLNSSTASVTQALKALGLEGEQWLEDVEIPPKRVLELQEDQILDLEIQANSEFFEGNSVKTPERYLRIRNHILRSWISNKSRYVTKTSVRRGLRDCGDVNAIGRVHQFLELVGAINFGLEAPASCRKQGQPEPISVLMMSKAPLHQVLQPVFGNKKSPSSLNSSMNSTFSTSSFASTVSSSSHLSKVTNRSQFDPSYEIVKNPTVALPHVAISSNAIMVMDLHAHLHARDGFGLIAGQWDPEKNEIVLRYAMPYTGPQSSSQSSMTIVSAWERSVINWVENSATAKAIARESLPLEILGYYTTHKLLGAMSLTQFTHYKNVFCKGQSRTRPFIGVFAIPFERPPDSTSFSCVMYPLGSTPGGLPPKTLYSLKRHILCEKKLPQEQFAQLFAAYHNNEVAVCLVDRDENEPHRTLLERCIVSLSSAVYVSEREKNSTWEQLKVFASEGVSSKLISMLNTKDPVWTFREFPASVAPATNLQSSNQQPLVLGAASSVTSPSSAFAMSPSSDADSSRYVSAKSMSPLHNNQYSQANGNMLSKPLSAAGVVPQSPERPTSNLPFPLSNNGLPRAPDFS